LVHLEYRDKREIAERTDTTGYPEDPVPKETRDFLV